MQNIKTEEHSLHPQVHLHSMAKSGVVTKSLALHRATSDPVSWRSTKYAPSQDGPLQCEAVICCVSFFFLFAERLSQPFLRTPQFKPMESSELSSSVPVKRFEFKLQNEPVHFSEIVISSRHSHDPTVVVTSSERYTDKCQGSCDR